MSNINFRKMFKLKKFRQKGNDKAVDEPLLRNRTVQQTKTTEEKHICNTDTTDLSGLHPDQISTEAEVSGDDVLSVLRKILSAQSNAQDLDNAAVLMHSWGKLNGVTMEKKEGSYPQDWLCDFLQLIDQSVEGNFPILPTDETQTSQQLQEFLKSAENVICSEVCRLTPVLKDAGLLVYLIQSYSHQLFTKLNLLINRNLSVDDTFCLLLWGKRVFFSPDTQDAFSVHDPLMLSGWFERAKHNLLIVLKGEIFRNLQNILRYEEQHEDKESSMNEEWFIRVHIDVTQCLIAVIQNAEQYSLTLMNSVQILCLEELHNFTQKYVNGEKQHLENLQPLKTNFVYLCRTISTCMKLRCFAAQINDQDKNETADILKTLEDQVLSIVQNKIKDLALECLQSYFKSGDEHFDNLTEKIQMQCSSLTEAAEEIKTMTVNLAYDCVSRVYLDCLINSNFKRLERRWENVEEKIKQDVQNFQNTFAQLNGSDDQNQLLKRMTEVLFDRDVEPLKITCCTLFNDFPQDSEQYVPGLLRWKRTLSKQQVREVLDASRLKCLNPERDNRPLKYLCCCLCCCKTAQSSNNVL